MADAHLPAKLRRLAHVRELRVPPPPHLNQPQSAIGHAGVKHVAVLVKELVGQRQHLLVVGHADHVRNTVTRQLARQADVRQLVPLNGHEKLRQDVQERLVAVVHVRAPHAQVFQVVNALDAHRVGLVLGDRRPSREDVPQPCGADVRVDQPRRDQPVGAEKHADSLGSAARVDACVHRIRGVLSRPGPCNLVERDVRTGFADVGPSLAVELQMQPQRVLEDRFLVERPHVRGEAQRQRSEAAPYPDLRCPRRQGEAGRHRTGPHGGAWPHRPRDRGLRAERQRGRPQRAFDVDARQHGRRSRERKSPGARRGDRPHARPDPQRERGVERTRSQRRNDPARRRHLGSEGQSSGPESGSSADLLFRNDVERCGHRARSHGALDPDALLRAQVGLERQGSRLERRDNLRAAQRHAKRDGQIGVGRDRSDQGRDPVRTPHVTVAQRCARSGDRHLGGADRQRHGFVGILPVGYQVVATDVAGSGRRVRQPQRDRVVSSSRESDLADPARLAFRREESVQSNRRRKDSR